VVFLLLKFAIEDFLDDRRFKNLSPRTIEDYKQILNDFYSFITEQGKMNVEDVTTGDIKRYLLQAKDKGNKPTTINRKLVNLKIFFNYMVQEKIISENPVKLQRQKVDVKIETFTDEQVRQILGYFRRLKQREKTFYAYRDYLIILTLLGTGIRRGELCNLRWKDIDFENYKMIVMGKKRQQRTVPLTEKLRQELIEYQLFLKKRFSLTDDDFVFTTSTKRRLSENALGNIFKRLSKIMNFKDVRLSPHTFRHTFAKNWIMNGGDVFSLQRILGHSTIDMTNRYVTLFGSALKEQNDKFNPLNNMDL
jgi:integrase/recombinase XerD